MKYIKLSTYAKNNGISYMTAWRHVKQGLIKNVKQLPTGTILIGVDEEKHNLIRNRAIIYSRVSNHGAKENLERQSSRLQDYAIKNGYLIQDNVKEIASGMNDNRKKLLRILERDDFDVLIVEHKDRLTRFGFNYIKTLLKSKGIDIIVVNENHEDMRDLMEDLVAIIYSFSARLYGKRGSKKKSKKLIKQLEDEIS